eukprot:6196663-Pleurochrysis_carterae.AAC.1
MERVREGSETERTRLEGGGKRATGREGRVCETAQVVVGERKASQRACKGLKKRAGRGRAKREAKNEAFTATHGARAYVLITRACAMPARVRGA